MSSSIRLGSKSISSSDNSFTSYVKPACGILLAVGGAYALFKGYQSITRRRRQLESLAWKRTQRESQIAQLQQRLRTNNDQSVEGRRREITSLSFESLRSKLQNGELRATEVLEAFQWRALQAQEKTNCVCEFLLEATEWADQLDRRYSNGGQQQRRPPLFGIPVSVKECNRLIGHDSNVGMVQYVDQPSDRDSNLVMVLKEMGAIPFCTTNIPQSMMSIGSSNPVYGVTTNPYDPTRSSGGSSSGEGALIALRGSPLGIGTDVGGSVRVPAAWCGICSLKPSVARLTNGGRMGIVQGQSIMRGTAGPMGPDVDSLVHFMRAVCDRQMFDLDPYVIPHRFDESLYDGGERSSLTIGYYDYDNWMQAAPACRRAVDVARRILEARGHRLVRVELPFDPKEMRRFFSAYTAALVPDGGDYPSRKCAVDVVDPFHKDLMTLFGQSNWYRRLRAKFAGSSRSAAIMNGFPSNLIEQRDNYFRIDTYRLRFVEFWRRHQLDAIICPAVATPALPYSLPPKLFVILWAYTAFYNLLDYAAGIVPCGYVSANDEEKALMEDASHFDEVDWITRELKQCARGTTGLPIGVQCATLPYREELCLRVMKEIEEGVKKMEADMLK